MPKAKRLSGQDCIKIFERFGFTIDGQHGSHVKLVRVTLSGKEILLIPNHKELKTGTSLAIYKKALLYISEQELRPYFYSS